MERALAYFGMWMATTTSRMTFLDPGAIVPRATFSSSAGRTDSRRHWLSCDPSSDFPPKGVSAAEARQVP
jgi:hypothetical protein